MFKKYYSEFLKSKNDLLHFAAHSHHYWPDCTFEAHKQYWLDSARLVDDKWNLFLGEKRIQTTKLISEVIDVDYPNQIVFAPNTSELVFRLISALDWSREIKILSTPNEFHSFSRLARRLSELKQFSFREAPFKDFSELLSKEKFDMVYFSRVYFNSGLLSEDWERLVLSSSSDTIFCMDDYHGFMALPISLKKVQNKIFYLAGSYKYAQGGEGACFLYCPPKIKLRPFYTGWFADFNALESENKKVDYSDSGMGMAGSTMDFSAMYRLESALSLFKSEEITVEAIHSHVQKLQKLFLNEPKLSGFHSKFIGDHDLNSHGHFLTYELETTQKSQELMQSLRKKNIIVDTRGCRLRFGFGMYHDENDVKELSKRILNI